MRERAHPRNMLPTPWQCSRRGRRCRRDRRSASISSPTRRSAPQWRGWRACAICRAWRRISTSRRRGAAACTWPGGFRPPSVRSASSRSNRSSMRSRKTIDLLFVPQPTAEREDGEVGTRGESADETEPLIGGLVDLGALATEFLILGLDPYPRKPGAVFQPPPEAKPDESPVRRARMRSRRVRMTTDRSCVRIAEPLLSCAVSPPPCSDQERDPERACPGRHPGWQPVFGKDHAQTKIPRP